jgi:tight adherence protein C
VIRAVVLAVAATTFAAAAIVDLATVIAGDRRRHSRSRPRGASHEWPAQARDHRRRRVVAGLPVALAALGRRLGAPAAPGDLARRLDAAGAPPGIALAEVMALKGGAAVTAFVAVLPLALVLPGRLGPVAAIGVPAAAFLAPDAWLARRTRRRRVAMAAELPDVLDLLHVAVAAGQSPLRALGEVGRRRSGALAAELRAATARAALGLPRHEALGLLARRCPVEGVAALVAAIARADRHGAPLGPSLRAQAADARAQSAQRLREQAARAGPKIQLVVALLLVPAVMLLVGACLAAGVLQR